MSIVNAASEAVGIQGNKIAMIGASADILSASGPSTRIIDSRRRAIVPGFIDSHTHFMSMGAALLQLDLSNARSLPELLSRVEKQSKSSPPGDWIRGHSWDESRWPENRFPILKELDRASPHNPVWLRRVDGHMGVTNTLGLKRLGIPPSTRGLERDAENELTGVLREEAGDLADYKLRPSRRHLLMGLKRAIGVAYREGVTSIHEMAEDDQIELYRSLAARKKLGIRVYMNFYQASFDQMLNEGAKTGDGDAFLRIGALKLFADGSLGSRTAALFEDYEDCRGEKGMLIHAQSELNSLVKKADGNDIQLAIHAIGERGIDAALRAVEAGAAKHSLKKRRHRIEHFELVDSRAKQRARKLRVTLSMQPNFVGQWSQPCGMYEKRLGQRRLKLNNPLGQLFRDGFPVAFGSDCMPFSPLYGIRSCVRAPFASQRLPAIDAFRCYSAAGAYASGEEKLKGTIEVGKLADLVVLSDDPFKDENRRDNVKVDMTILDGQVVYVRRGVADLHAQLPERRKKASE